MIESTRPGLGPYYPVLSATIVLVKETILGRRPGTLNDALTAQSTDAIRTQCVVVLLIEHSAEDKTAESCSCSGGCFDPADSPYPACVVEESFRRLVAAR